MDITEAIQNAIVTVSQGDLNYIFVKSDQFPNLTATITHKAESETLTLEVTKNTAELVYSEFTTTGENGRNIDDINLSVYNVDGNLTVTTPFQNAADFSSSFTDSASIEGYSALEENANSVEGFEAIILTDDAFVTDYITTPMIQANGHALVVAHNAGTAGQEMFASYSNVSDAYVAGTANGASISANAEGIDLSNLSNNKFFGTVIKSGVESGDFLGFTNNSESIVNYMAIVNDGGNDFSGMTLSGGQTLKGVIIAADAATNTKGGDINISGSTAQGVIVKAGDGANGRYSGYRNMIWDREQNNYSYFFNEYTFNRSGDITTRGNIEVVKDNVTQINAFDGMKGGYVCLYNAEEYLDPLTEIFAGNLGLRSISMEIYRDYNSGQNHWTGSLYPDGSERRIGNVMLKFQIERGLTTRIVDTAASTGCNISNPYYVIFGQDAENRTAGSYANSNVWLGMGRGDFYFDGSYYNAWWFKYLFVTIMYKEDSTGIIIVENDTNTETDESSSEVSKLPKDYYQKYPLPTASTET